MVQKSSIIDVTIATERSEPPAKKRVSVLDRLLGEDDDKEEDDNVSSYEEITVYFQHAPSREKKIHFVGGKVMLVVFHTLLF